MRKALATTVEVEVAEQLNKLINGQYRCVYCHFMIIILFVRLKFFFVCSTIIKIVFDSAISLYICFIVTTIYPPAVCLLPSFLSSRKLVKDIRDVYGPHSDTAPRPLHKVL